MTRRSLQVLRCRPADSCRWRPGRLPPSAGGQAFASSQVRTILAAKKGEFASVNAACRPGGRKGVLTFGRSAGRIAANNRPGCRPGRSSHNRSPNGAMRDSARGRAGDREPGQLRTGSGRAGPSVPSSAPEVRLPVPGGAEAAPRACRPDTTGRYRSEAIASDPALPAGAQRGPGAEGGRVRRKAGWYREARETSPLEGRGLFFYPADGSRGGRRSRTGGGPGGRGGRRRG